VCVFRLVQQGVTTPHSHSLQGGSNEAGRVEKCAIGCVALPSIQLKSEKRQETYSHHDYADAKARSTEFFRSTGSADFFGKTPKELKSEFKKSLKVFLAVCAEHKIAPRKNYSGKFNLRIAPDLHERLAIVAQAEGKSLNKLAEEALALRVAA